MVILNFSHPLTAEHLGRIEELTGDRVEAVVAMKTEFQHDQPFAAQASKLADGAGLTAEEWQTRQIVINPPSLSAIACTLLVELHGRMGYFPPIVRLRPVAHATPPRFEVAELLDLQTIRDAARQTR